jgi:hypothetical protein
LLIALLSVASIAGPVIKDIFSEPDSDLIGSFQRIEEESAIFLVSNAGDRPGTIERVWLDATYTPGPSELIEIKGIPLTLLTNDLFVEPGESVLVQAKIPAPAKEWFRSSAAGETPYCTLLLKMTNFGGGTTATRTAEPCRSMYERFFPYELPIAPTEK